MMAQVACGWKKKDEKNTHGSCLNWNKSSSIIGLFVGLTESLSRRRYIAVESSRVWFQHHRREDREELREGRCCAELPWFLRLSCRSCWISAKAGTPVSYQSTSRELWICSGDDESRQYTFPSMYIIDHISFPPFMYFLFYYYLYRLLHWPTCFQNVNSILIWNIQWDTNVCRLMVNKLHWSI